MSWLDRIAGPAHKINIWHINATIIFNGLLLFDNLMLDLKFSPNWAKIGLGFASILGEEQFDLTRFGVLAEM